MSDREDRPTKRLRVEQADSQEGQLQDQVSQPATYLLRAPHAYPQQAPTFSQPTHISSFSFDGQRTLLTKSSGKNDAGLRFFTPPPLPCDLNTNFSQATFRDDSLVEGLDALLGMYVWNFCGFSSNFRTLVYTHSHSLPFGTPSNISDYRTSDKDETDNMAWNADSSCDCVV